MRTAQLQWRSTGWLMGDGKKSASLEAVLEDQSEQPDDDQKADEKDHADRTADEFEHWAVSFPGVQLWRHNAPERRLIPRGLVHRYTATAIPLPPVAAPVYGVVIDSDSGD